MRKLASVQRIKDIQPIEGADRIEKATVLGWHLVTGKGEFHPGDLVIYCEIDSMFPQWLKDLSGMKDKVLKTRRFKGVYSQGFCMPLDKVVRAREKMTDKPFSLKAPELGMDLTEYLGIKKWDPDARNGSKKWWKNRTNRKPHGWIAKFRLGRWLWKKFHKDQYGPFPTGLVPKSDETRCQILGNYLKRYKGTPCQYTEKLDGSSITFFLDRKKIFGKPIGRKVLRVCSRNREIFDKKDFMYEAAAKLKDKLVPGFIYQGELLGPAIQSNKYGVVGNRIFIYQAWDRRTNHYLDPIDLEDHLEEQELPQVPILGEFELTDDIDKLVEMAEGDSILGCRTKNTPREGIVIRPLTDIEGLDPKYFVDGRFSFKAINPKFLVKYHL